jgi:tetratricopeptide (TPR) repeat protein
MITADGRYPFQKVPESWIDLGVAYLNKGYFPRSLEAFDEALSLDPGNPVIHRNLGDLQFAVFSKTKEPQAYEKALEHYRKALEINPRDPSAQNGLGYAYLAGKNPKEAIGFFVKALEIYPDYPSALYNLGLAYYKTRDFRAAFTKLTSFKEKYGHTLSPAQGQGLETLIQRCRAQFRSPY